MTAGLSRLVHSEISLALELDNVARHESGNIAVCQYFCAEFSLRRQVMLDVVQFLKFVFRNEVAEIDQMNWHELLLLSKPRDFLLGLFEVALQL